MSGHLRSALVTGATGFLGSVLVNRLLSEGVEVTCLVRAQSMAKARQFASNPQVRIIAVESTDLRSKLAGISADVVFQSGLVWVRET